MPCYDWTTPVIRSAFGIFGAFLALLVTHLGVTFHPGPVCSGDWHEGPFAFFQYAAAIVVIEAITWAAWYVVVRPKVPRARPGIDDPDYVVSRGPFLGSGLTSWRALLLILLLLASGVLVGIPDPCQPMDFDGFSIRSFVGGLLLMYGFLVAINYKFDKQSEPTNIAS